MLLGIDFGTSYFKVGLFDRAGGLQGLGRVAVAKDAPAPGRAELPVARFWALLRRGLAEALAQAGGGAAGVAGMAYSSQANSFVLLDAADAPLTPIILWTDQRADPLPADLAAFSRTDEFARTAGFRGWSAGFAAAKWRWFQRHEPALWARVRRVLTLPEYFTLALTGERVGDASTAAFTGLYDLARGQWSEPALTLAGVAATQLPAPLLPGSPAGRTRSRAGELLGLPAGIAFAVGGLDHHVAALGSGLGRLAEVSISTGTVLAAMTLVRQPEPRAGCFHGPHFEAGCLYRLAFDPHGAGQLEDYQRRQAPELTMEQLLELAAAAPAGFAAAGPYPPNPHGSAVRRLLGTIAATQRELVARVAAGAPVSRIVATGGGVRSPLWLQIQADTIGAAVLTPASPEPACVGAALIAAVAAGWQPDLAAAAGAMVAPGRTFAPAGRGVA